MTITAYAYYSDIQPVVFAKWTKTPTWSDQSAQGTFDFGNSQVNVTITNAGCVRTIVRVAGALSA